MNVGIFAWCNQIELGDEREVVHFFDELREFHVKRNGSDKKNRVINLRYIDRLYGKYVLREDLLATLDLVFMFTRNIILNYDVRKHESLVRVGLGIVKAFHSALYGIWFEKFYEIPVHLMIIDRPYWALKAAEDIPLEDYDNLEGDPLWMRPEYMLEKYG